MTEILSGNGRSAVSALCGALLLSACAGNPPAASADSGRVDPYRAVVAWKSHGQIGPHLPAAAGDATKQRQTAQPASFQAVTEAKTHGAIGPHLEAAVAPPPLVAMRGCQPGSYEALMSGKLPPSMRPGNPEWYRDCR